MPRERHVRQTARKVEKSAMELRHVMIKLSNSAGRDSHPFVGSSLTSTLFLETASDDDEITVEAVHDESLDKHFFFFYKSGHPPPVSY